MGLRLSLKVLLPCVVLAAVACVQIGKGVQSLVWREDRALDLNMRFQEVHLFWGITLETEKTMPAGVFTRWDWENYLPHSHIIGLLLAPPFDWQVTRFYFAAISLAALCALLYTCHRLLPKPAPPVWISAPCVFACSNIQTSLAFGQYSILVALCLTASVARIKAGDAIGSAALLVVAAVKPVLALPLFVLLFTFRAWKIVLPAAGAIAALNAIGFLLSDKAFGEHLQTYSFRSALYMGRGFGLNTAFALIGLPVTWSKYLGLAITLAGALWLSGRYPDYYKRDALRLAAIACFAGRTWFPAYTHDNLLLIPLFYWWIGRALGRPSRLASLTAAAVGLSLWIPGRWMMMPEIAALQWGTWLFAVFMLIRLSEQTAADSTRTASSSPPA